MKPLPHHYAVSARGGAAGDVTVSAAGVDDLASGPPPEFGGSGEVWSPESMLTAAVASCFVLTFRAVARGAQLASYDVACDVDGKLDRVDGQLRFVHMALRARLVVPSGTDPERARTLLEKAERTCLVSQSLACETTLIADVVAA